MKSEEKIANSNSFFIDALKEMEKFPNEISYFNKHIEQEYEFTNIQLKIILDKFLSLKDKNFLRIDRISQRNLEYFLEQNLTTHFENVFICTEDVFDLSPYVKKINNKNFLFVMGNDFNFNFLNGLKELHIFLEDFTAFENCSEILNNVISTNLIQSIEFIFKNETATKFYEPLEKILLNPKNIFCIMQLVLHNNKANFEKESFEKFVNYLLLNHKSLRILKIVGFELPLNDFEVEEIEQNVNSNEIGNGNGLSLNKMADLAFEFDIENILAINKKIKILSVSHDRRFQNSNKNEYFEKFYICKTKELIYEILACRYLNIVRNNFLPAEQFFHKINGFIRKYLIKFFKVKIFEIKNDFITNLYNFNDCSEIKKLPDHIISKIEKIAFERRNIKYLNLQSFLEEVFGEDF